MSGDEDDEYDDVPLQHKTPFGSGLRRNEIKFVPASSENQRVTGQPGAATQGQSISDFYLNMVLRKPGTDTSDSSEAALVQTDLCEICKLPLTSSTAASSSSSGGKLTPHEASIAHQVCLTHSHPPSAVDRNRMGLSVLENQGWDPDSRTGLGAGGQGAHYPIKVKPKDNNLGIGVVVPKAFRIKKEKEKPKLLDAKKVRKMAADDRKRTDKLQQQIFGRVDLERYLGKDA